ncbi:uncharacterized protein TNCT_227251 [Trichonephila clavata]|uniref:Uncharacterized protein n=1 Tax=Trichonephila clavata TaxID=2740835 RepID=A0A8X6EXZ8_TRICU|nr:uncharacterized protein TNCT_227251 [Trichonephila clavata]
MVVVIGETDPKSSQALILCGTVSIFSWIILYLSKFRKNVMTLEELEQHWVSEFRSCVGFSFYLVVISTTLFIVNVAIISTIIKQPWVDRKLRRPRLVDERYGVLVFSSDVERKLGEHSQRVLNGASSSDHK